MSEGAASAVEIQERDLDILLGLFECRVMTLKHVTQLYFDGKAEAAKKRIQKLKQAGFVRERPRMVGDPSVLHLSKKAFAVLHHSGRLDAFPAITSSLLKKRAQVSELTLRHELEVMDVRAAICGAIRGNPVLSVSEFSTWPLLFHFTARLNHPVFGRKEVMMKPDAFIRIREDEEGGTFEHLFFLEVDRSTEAQEIIGQKAACYLDNYQTGGMAMRFGASREKFRQFPFRVLMVFKNDERRNNAAERLLQNSPPIMTQVWLSTFKEVLAAPLGAIWIRPKDYLEVTRNGQFNPMRADRGFIYRRQLERENIVRANIRKQVLFEALCGSEC